MSYYTRFGSQLWSWDPWLELERDPDDLIGCRARILWLALYTAPEAKRILPGLWHGSISTMSDASRMTPDHVFNALQRLLDHDLVDYDQKLRVVRLTRLPDAGESPQNGKVIRSWYMRFQSVPRCAVRDAHVATIRWMMDEWSRETGKPISNDHARAWADTFAQVSIPVGIKHGTRTLFNHDTSTPQQPSLFSPLRASGGRSADGFTVSDTVSETQFTSGSSEKPKPNDSAGPFTVSDTVGSGSGSGSGSLLSEKGGGSGGGITVDDLLSEMRSPVAVLTVLDGGFDVQDLFAVLKASRPGYPKDPTGPQWASLGQAIGSIAAARRTPHALTCLREYIASGMEGFPHQPMNAEQRCSPGADLAPEIVGAPGWLARALEHALAWKSRVDERLELAKQARAALGYDPKDETT